jgi:hypothetical protein
MPRPRAAPRQRGKWPKGRGCPPSALVPGWGPGPPRPLASSGMPQAIPAQPEAGGAGPFQPRLPAETKPSPGRVAAGIARRRGWRPAMARALWPGRPGRSPSAGGALASGLGQRQIDAAAERPSWRQRRY